MPRIQLKRRHEIPNASGAPAPIVSSAASCAFSLAASAITTLAPSRPNTLAVARPIPLTAPAMIATRPRSALSPFNWPPLVRHGVLFHSLQSWKLHLLPNGPGRPANRSAPEDRRSVL